MLSTNFFKFDANTRTLTADNESFRQYFQDRFDDAFYTGSEDEPNLNVLSNDNQHVFVLQDDRTGRAVKMVRTCVEWENDNGEVSSEEYRPLYPQDDLWFDRIVLVTDDLE